MCRAATMKQEVQLVRRASTLGGMRTACRSCVTSKGLQCTYSS